MNNLVAQFLEVIEHTRYPQSDELSAEALAMYEQGNEIMLGYRGNPQLLISALEVYVKSGSRPPMPEPHAF